MPDRLLLPFRVHFVREWRGTEQRDCEDVTAETADHARAVARPRIRARCGAAFRITKVKIRRDET